MSAAESLNGLQFARYTVVSAHQPVGAKRHSVRRVSFDTAEDADEHMRRLDPMTDGTMLPNVPDSVIKSHERKGLEYSSGLLQRGNRPAITFLNPALGSKYRDA